MSWRGFEKRVKSPTSATSTTALISAIPASPARRQQLGAEFHSGRRLEYLFLDALEAPLRIHDGIDIVLKCDLLRGMSEGQSRQPPPISHSPRRPTPVLAAVTQQKTLKMLTRARHDLSRRRCAAGSDRAWLRDRRQAPRRASTLPAR